MLEKLGIYGLENIENAILAGLVTGDPVLLVGSHGSGKTLLCQRLAQAMGTKFWAYDASKALFEDVLGFPDPSSLATGQVEYVPTAISIWGKEFVLIDELSRANPSMQNKWLEVIRSRKIMGKGLTDLKYIFAAMNPPTYLGTHPLDEALTGRFAVIVRIPEASEIDDEALLGIVQQISEDDAPMLRNRTEIKSQAGHLQKFIGNCRSRMDRFPEQWRGQLTNYVIALSRFFALHNIMLDSRRLGMIWRTIQAYIAVVEKDTLDENEDLAGLEDVIQDCLLYTMPFAALGNANAEVAISGAHYHALPALEGDRPRTLMVLPPNPGKAVKTFIERAPEMLPEEQKAGLTNFISRAKSMKETEQRAPAFLALIDLATAMCNNEFTLEPDDQYRLLSFFLDSTMIDIEGDNSEIEEVFRTLSGVMQLNQAADLQKTGAFLGFRVGCQFPQDSGSGQKRGNRDENTIAAMSREFQRLLDK